MSTKHRLSASVDAELLEAAEEAVENGQAPSVSAWVNDALRLKLEHERRLEALASFVAAYEAEHGEIDEEEIRQARRCTRARARSVRTLQGPGRARKDSRRS
ncbi:MAG: hypothetical protein ACOCUS_01970 [Polyangiales bacterium]